MKFNKIKKIIIFGGSPLLIEVGKYLKSIKFEFKIYTSPRQAREKIDENGRTLFDLLKLEKLEFVIAEDINSIINLNDEININTLGLGLGEAWKFNEKIIESFNGRLLDLMPIPHPRFRGGAHYTWMILMGCYDGGCNLQVVNNQTVQGEFDNGEIVKSLKYKFSKKARIPRDYFVEALNFEVEFIKSFLNEVRNEKSFILKKPYENISLFFPRLNTFENGWINWNWSGEDILKFICAFDEPYMGASSRIKGTRVHLKGATLKKTNDKYHPFQYGLIIRINKLQKYIIATSSGNLIVNKIMTNGKKLKIAVGDRLYSFPGDVKSSMTKRIVYGSK